MLDNFRIKFSLFLNRLRYDFRIHKKGKRTRITIPERFKKYVKITKTIIILVGLLSSFIIFGSMLISFLFGLGLFLIGTLLERFVFTYTAIYIPPIHTFEPEPDKWIGNAFGVTRAVNGSFEMLTAGPIFSDVEYAKKVHNLILTWSFGEYDDKGNNVILSAIVENNSYWFFIYPSITRKTIKRFMSKFEKEIKEVDPDGEPNYLFTMQILMKHCDITDNSYFPTFRSRYRQGIPYLLQFFHNSDATNYSVINELRSLRLYNLKIRDRHELTRKDLEYDLIRILK